MATGDVHHIVGGLKPAKAALKFSAVADAQLAIDAFAVTRFAANDTAGTITAWITPVDITGDYAVVSFGDTAAIEFITLSIKAGKIRIECRDATVLQYDHASTDVVLTPHKLTHIAVTQNALIGAENPPKLYIDGVQVATTMTDETDNGTWFADLDLVDDGSIGAAEEAGAAAVVKEFKGGISDVKYWKVELTPQEVNDDYKGKDPTRISTSGDLTDHWDFSKTEAAVVTNVVTAANNGAITGALFQNSYSEFTSRLGFQVVAVVADSINIAIDDETGHAVVIVA